MRLLLPILALSAFVLAANAPSPPISTGDASDHTHRSLRADTTEWENLQVIPDRLSRGVVLGIMNNFAVGLGVGCDHCHVQDGPGIDFASDDNPRKAIARDMIGMVRQLNGQTIPSIVPDSILINDSLLVRPLGRTARVTCWTCHRGSPVPATEVPTTGTRR